MGFWIYMTFIACLLPLTIIGFGRYFIKTAPKNINYVFGYRTSMSMKNEDTWKFAHRYCGKIWYIGGIICLIISIITMIVVLGKDSEIIGYVGAVCMFIPILMIIISVIITEKALRKNFNRYGHKIK